jgi:peptide/nickel transport system substrate-binding protein
MTTPVRPDPTVVYGMVGLPAEFDPHDQVVPNDFGTRLVFDALVATDDAGELVPRLAESWRLVDERTWEFVLRDDARFASGRAVDATSVQWNFERVRATPRFVASPRIATLERVEAVDARTVRFHTRGPDAIWPKRAVQVVIADPHTAVNGGFGPFPSAEAGSGLFRLVDFVPGRRLRLERSERSWRGRAPIAALEMRGYAPDALEAALRAGDVHLGYLTEEQADRMGDSGLRLQRVLQGNVHTLRFNSLRPPFDDRRLREALTLAFDRPRMVAEAYRGRGGAPNQIVGPECHGYDPSLPSARVDLDRARALVAESGFTGELTFDVLASSAVIRPWCEWLIARLNMIGLATRPVHVDMPTYLGKMIRNDPPRSDLIGAGNQYVPGLDAAFALDKWSNRLPPASVEYSNAEYQACYEASLVEFDPARRLDLLRRCARLLLDDFACVPALQPALSWFVSPRLRGLTMNCAGAGWVDWLGVGFD